MGQRTVEASPNPCFRKSTMNMESATHEERRTVVISRS
jgi:hypothetical protein